MKKKIPLFRFKQNGQFWSMIDGDGKNRTGEGKMNTIIYY